MGLVSAFMAARRAEAFILAAELQEPDAVYAAGATRLGTAAALPRISRDPTRFTAPEWLPAAALGYEIPGLLPPPDATLDARTRVKSAPSAF